VQRRVTEREATASRSLDVMNLGWRNLWIGSRGARAAERGG